MLRDLISSVCDTYPTYYQDRIDFWKRNGTRQPTVSKDYEVHNILVNHFREEIRSILPSELNTERLEIAGSDGTGVITPGPWVNIRIPQLAPSTQEGFYPVYLFSLDMSRIYLALALGSTVFTDNKIANNSMLAAGEMLSKKILPIAFRELDIPEDINFPSGKLDLSVQKWTQEYGRKPRIPAKYEYSNIFAIEYSADDLPENEVLEQHLILFTKIYAHLATIPNFPRPIDLLVSERNQAGLPAIFLQQSAQHSLPGIPSNAIPPTGGQTVTNRSEPRLTPSNVYFARFGGTDFYKIGRGRNPQARVNEFNKHIPNRDNEIPTIGRWELVDFVSFDSELDAHESEIDTHSWLKEFRTHQERFKGTEAKIQEAVTRLRALIDQK